MAEETLTVRVNRVTDEAEGIRSFEFVDPSGADLPPFTAGAHVDVFPPNGPARQYSLCNDPTERHRYVVSVLREPESRGGSVAMHMGVTEGATIAISAPRNNFPLSTEAGRHVLIAGGIGITPVMAMVRHLHSAGADYKLYYCTRSPAQTAFRKVLGDAPFAAHVEFIHDGGDPAKGLDVKATLATVEPGTHVYCCGPAGLMEAVKTASEHWPAGSIHFEYFTADQEVLSAPKSGFEVEIASTGAVLTVPDDKSILAVLRENGFEVESMCEEGVCGTCITGLLEGEADHRDMILSDDEQANSITVCCSRAKSDRLKLDL